MEVRAIRLLRELGMMREEVVGKELVCMTQSVNERVDELTKKIANGAVRERVARNITQLLSDLETIVSYAEDDDVDQNWVDDGSDGVPLTSIAQIEQREEAKITSLKDTNFFPASAIEVTLDDDDINARGKFGYTKLHCAVADEDLKLVVELLEMGADANIRDNSGSTPYQKALNRGYMEIAAVLRDYTFLDEDAETAEAENETQIA
jgi:ankyrin repeat protein